MVQLVLWGRVDLQSPRRFCWSVAAKRRSILLWVGESLACFVVCFVYFLWAYFFVVTSPQWNIPRSQCNNGIAVGEGWDWWDFGRPLVPPHRWGVSKRFIATAVLWGEANFVSARGRNTRVVWLGPPARISNEFNVKSEYVWWLREVSSSWSLLEWFCGMCTWTRSQTGYLWSQCVSWMEKTLPSGPVFSVCWDGNMENA